MHPRSQGHGGPGLSHQAADVPKSIGSESYVSSICLESGARHTVWPQERDHVKSVYWINQIDFLTWLLLGQKVVKLWFTIGGRHRQATTRC